MLIKNIKINSYKNIKEPLFLDCQPINIFIGQNNVGKSNVLDAIEFALKNQADDKLSYPQSDIVLNLEFTSTEQLKYDLPDQTAVFEFNHETRNLVFGNQRLPYNKTLESIFSSNIKRITEDTFSNLAQIQVDYESLSTYPGALEQFKANLKKHFPKISTTKNALDVDYTHEGLYEGDRRVTIDRLGSGFRRIFTILLYVFHPDYSIVLIDEPETHLHPAMIKKLLWAMQNSEAGQIFFTTHSPLFLTPITLTQVVRITKDEVSTKAFSFANIKYDYKKLVSELDDDNLQMFFADKVILVEGVSDRLLFRGLIDKFYQGDKDIKVIQTHGKGNVKIYAYLLKMSNIPFIIVLDKDAMITEHINELMHFFNLRLPSSNEHELIQELKRHHIFVLATGDLENNYPRKYQLDDSKSLNALRAANDITEAEFNSKRMAYLKEIINSL